MHDNVHVSVTAGELLKAISFASVTTARDVMDKNAIGEMDITKFSMGIFVVELKKCYVLVEIIIPAQYSLKVQNLGLKQFIHSYFYL